MDKSSEPQNEHIELSQLNGLIDAAGIEGAKEILDAFWRSTEELLDLSSTQVTDNDLEAAAKTAHALKGMAANVGAAKLAVTASKLEVACKSNKRDMAHEHTVEARGDFQLARNYLLDHLQKAS